MLYLLRVQGDSMHPSLQDGDRLLALSTSLRNIEPGRIVAFRRSGQLFLKRALTLERGGWFVVGDNSARSTDSRRFGPVPESEIEAVVLCRLPRLLPI